jgi:hypothetical protein
MECRSTTAVVASLMIKGKKLSVTDPEIVLVSWPEHGGC